MVDEPATSEAETGSQAGSRFGHYLLQRLLGRGGFGEVYAAHDTEMDRVVALKLIAAPYSQNQVFRQRLYREARTAGRLHEPHVVPVHHCGEIDGQLYIDMRLIEGSDLQAVLVRDGPLKPERTVAIVRHIAAALDAAHAQQVVHRDVKPANILLTGDDFAYLVDFGLANAAADAKLTSSGTAIGTFAYMAPERLSNAEVSARADIYALACVLYECLTGTPPYITGDLPALITAHLTAPVPRPSRRWPQIPASFDDVIARGMAKNPDDRYSSAGDLARAARRALTMPDQDRADPAALSTQSPHLPSADQTATIEAAAVRPDASRSSRRAPPERPRAHGRRRAAIVITSSAIIALAIVLFVVIAFSRGASQQSELQPPAMPSASEHNRPKTYGPQVELPFTGLDHPSAIAVDAVDAVYITDGFNNRVLKLPVGSHIQVEMPFTGLAYPDGVAVDAVGVVSIADEGNSRVLKLPATLIDPVELPFTGLVLPNGVAVDRAGGVYVSSATGDRVYKLPAGSSTPVELPFSDLHGPWGVAVDAAGNVYVAELSGRVSKLPAGANTPIVLPFTGLVSPTSVTVDIAGNVYVTDEDVENATHSRVLKLLAGANTPVELPFTGLTHPSGVAVDTAGNVYVSDEGNNRVLKLPIE